MTKKETFKNRFRELVDDMGVSKTKCAQMIGISYKTFDNAYTLGKYPRTRNVIRIAEYFNVSLDYLACRTDKKR